MQDFLFSPSYEKVGNDMLDHPLREQLANEVHARPFLRIHGRARLSHIAIFSEDEPHIHDDLLIKFCSTFGISLPDDGANHISYVLDNFQFKWEKHTEFSTFTFVVTNPEDEPFVRSAIEHLPSEWVNCLAGRRLVALHAEVLQGNAAYNAKNLVRDWFCGPVLVGSRVLAGGEVWCDWHIHPDGFSRFLVLDLDFRESQAGRLLQRLYEIETYRMMALLSLPVARKMSGILDEMEHKLFAIVEGMDASLDNSEDPAFLLSLTNLAMRVQSLSSKCSRFNASRAYDRLLNARITELREERIEGVPTIGEFMERRLSPAINTCHSIQERQELLATHVARAADLLRTRVNMTQERQANALLLGMNQTANTQLRMQHAVEGLSVAAISYYVLSLISVALKALSSFGLPFDPEVGEGFLIIPVLALVFYCTSRLRQNLMKKDSH